MSVSAKKSESAKGFVHVNEGCGESNSNDNVRVNSERNNDSDGECVSHSERVRVCESQ